MKNKVVKAVTGVLMAATAVGAVAATSSSAVADFDPYLYQMEIAQQEYEYNLAQMELAQQAANEYNMYQMEVAQQEAEYNKEMAEYVQQEIMAEEIADYKAAKDAAAAIAERQYCFLVDEHNMCDRKYMEAEGFNVDKVYDVLYRFVSEYPEMASVSDYTVVATHAKCVYTDWVHYVWVDDEWKIVKNN